MRSTPSARRVRTPKVKYCNNLPGRSSNPTRQVNVMGAVGSFMGKECVRSVGVGLGEECCFACFGWCVCVWSGSFGLCPKLHNAPIDEPHKAA